MQWNHGYLFAISFLLVFSAGVSAAEERRVDVTGSCIRRVAPDRGAITVASEFRDDDLKAATRKATQAYERTRDAIKKLDLENGELTTSEYRVEQVREWQNGKMFLKGYLARMGLRVSTSSVQRLGEVIAIASREGLQDVGQLQMYLSDEKQSSEQMNCLKDAALDAKARAEKLALSLGAKLGSVINIQESARDSGPMPRPFAAMMASAERSKSADIAPPGIEAGQQDIQLTVRASFSLQ